MFFQSGSAIIAGGCNNEQPIFNAYDFINKILAELIPEIYKPDSKAKRLKKERNSTKYIEKNNINNPDDLQKILNYLAKIEKGSIDLVISDKLANIQNKLEKPLPKKFVPKSSNRLIIKKI